MALKNNFLAVISRYYMLLFVIGTLTFSLVSAQSQPSTAISTSLCNIVNTVRDVVGILALTLFIIGGALYAVAHMLPAAGNMKGNLQGWSLGMIVGGVVGLIIVIIAPGLIGLIISSAGSSGGVTAQTC